MKKDLWFAVQVLGLQLVASIIWEVVKAVKCSSQLALRFLVTHGWQWYSSIQKRDMRARTVSYVRFAAR